MATRIELDQLTYTYPEINTENFQTLLSAKKEFDELKSTGENLSTFGRTNLFRHQVLIRRYMLIYDRVLLFWSTGSGKTCGAFSSSEQLKAFVGALTDYVDIYLKPVRSNIKMVYVLTPNDTLVNALKMELVCKCTKGVYGTGSQTANAINKEIETFYTITTHESFGKILIAENLSPEGLKEKYSDSFFIVDEAHNVNVAAVTAEEADADANEEPAEILVSQKKRGLYSLIYQRLFALFHSIERSKVMLMTATPMQNSVQEFAPLINLIIPNDRELLPINLNYSEVTLEYMKSHLQGLISYVGRVESQVSISYDGQEIPGYHTKIVPSQASEKQEKVYKGSSSGGYRVRQRQILDFVYPDDSVGITGALRFINGIHRRRQAAAKRIPVPGEAPKRGRKPLTAESIADVDIFIPEGELVPYFSTIDNLELLSPKFADIYRYCTDNPGNCFVITNWVASGIIPLCAMFRTMRYVTTNPLYEGQEVTYKQFVNTKSVFRQLGSSESITRHYCTTTTKAEEVAREITIGKELRFAILTSETPDSAVRTILELFNSPENRYGEYLKVLLSPPAFHTGISLANVLTIELISSQWHRSNTYQALSRAIRATSHTALLEDVRIGIEAQNGNPEDAIIPIIIRQHALLVEGKESADIFLYKLSEDKDVLIKRMERILKQIAFDCQINYNMNIKTGGVDGSPECDYTTCIYQCSDPSPTEIDYSSYDALYSDEIVDAIIDDLKAFFSSHTSITLQELYTRLNYCEPKYILMALEKITTNNIVISNRYGFSNYLQVENNIVYLQAEYPITRNYALSYYTHLIGVGTESLDTISNRAQEPAQSDLLQRIQNLDTSSDTFLQDISTLVGRLNIKSRATLLEAAISTYVKFQEQLAAEEVIEEEIAQSSILVLTLLQIVFKPDWFELSEPVEEINAAFAIATNDANKKGKKSTKAPTPKKRDTIEENEIEGEGEIVYVHRVYTKRLDSNAKYAATTISRKVQGRLRLFKPSTGQWVDINSIELPVYTDKIQGIINRWIRDVEDKSPIYGEITTIDGIFRIVDTTTGEAGREKGRDCKPKAYVVEILWKLGIEPPEISLTPQEQEFILSEPNEEEEALIRERLINFLSTNRPKAASRDILERYDLARLRFYYLWYSRGTSNDEMCRILKDYFESNEALLIL